MNFKLLTIFLFIVASATAQTNRYEPAVQDTFMTCSLTKRDLLTGPFSSLHAAEFENLVATVFKASPFPAYPYSVFRTSDARTLQLGCMNLDALDFHSFFLYNLDSVMQLNLKARSRYGIMTLIAHHAGHHVLHHLVPPRAKDLTHQELQADYFAGWILARFNAPRSEVTNGLAVILSENEQAKEFPTPNARLNAILLGYDIGSNTQEAGPLKWLEEKKTLNMNWIKKWCRTVSPDPVHITPSDGLFSDLPERFVLDSNGNLVYTENNVHYVIASTIPSKDLQFKYMLYDSQFTYWWIDKEGVIYNATRNTQIGHVNLNLLLPEDEKR